MAIVKLADIPNAPDLASMSAPKVNNVNIQNVDFSSQRRTIAAGYEQALENPKTAGAIGGAVAQVGEGAYKAAKSYGDKQQELNEKQKELNDNAAWAEFSTNYAVQRGAFEDSLDRSRPDTWQAADAEFRAKNTFPQWQALPESVQQKFYGQFTRLYSEDQVKVGHSATQAKIEGDLVKQGTAINLAIEQGNFPKARESLEGMRAGLSAQQYETSLSKIDTSEQVNQLNTLIALRPDEWEAKLTDLYSKDEQIPGMSNITKDQIPKFIERAKGVAKVQLDQNYGSLSSAITNREFLSSVDLEKDERYAKIKNDKYKASLKEAFADRNLGRPEGEQASKYAMHSVLTYPQTDDPATEATALRVYNNENVPSIFRDAVNKALDSKISEMAANGGRLKPETELVQYGSQRLAVARNGGVFGKFYDPSDVKGDAAKAKANIEVMKQVEDVELILRNSGAKTRADVDRVVEEATASGIAKKNAGEIGQKKGWLDFLNSKKAEAVKPPSWMNGPQSSISKTPSANDFEYSTMQPDPNDPSWKRADGSLKGNGFLGLFKRPDGGVSSEISIGVKDSRINGGKETDIPSLVPTLSKSEIKYLLNTPEDQIQKVDPATFRSIQHKAVEFAAQRAKDGKNVFAQPNESPKMQAAGKITKYGYEKKGDKYYDTNSARGIGAADNKLTPGESVALSPDLEKSTGAKIGDKVVVTLSNGDKMVKQFDDRTMQDKQAIKRFGKPLRGRVDIYSPDGNQPLDGVRVAKVEKFTEDGRG